MGVHDLFNKREAQPGAAHHAAVGHRSTHEFAEDGALIAGWNADTAVAHADGELRPLAPLSRADVPAPGAYKQVVKHRDHEGGAADLVVTYVGAPVVEDPLGAIELAQPLASRTEYAWRGIWSGLTSSLAMLLVGATTVVLSGARVVGQPVSELIHATRRIGEGDFNVLDSIQRGDEFGELAGQAEFTHRRGQCSPPCSASRVFSATAPRSLLLLFGALRWRWAVIAGVIAVIFIPVIWVLIRREKRVAPDESSGSVVNSAAENYRTIFSDHRTYYVIPAAIMPAFWVTGLFLYQVAAAEALGWSLGLIASAFAAFAAARILSGLITGPLIDRFSARTLFPFLLIPMIAGLMFAYIVSASWAVFAYMGLIGATMGFSSTMKSALWAELFGTRMIGTVQSFFATIMVFSTALSPFLVGWMLDASFSMHSILMLAIVSSVISGLISVRIFPAFDRSFPA